MRRGPLLLLSSLTSLDALASAPSGCNQSLFRRSLTLSSRSELDQDVQVKRRLVFPQIWEPYRAALRSAGRLRGAERQCPGRMPVVAGKELGRPVVGIGHSTRTRRRDSTAASP